MTLGSALTAGYSLAELLGFLSSNYPNIGKKINEARKIGYDVNKIAEYFSSMTPQQVESVENSSILKGKNPWVDADKVQRESSAYNQAKKHAPKVIGALAPVGAFMAYRALKPAIVPLVQQGMDYLTGLGQEQPQEQQPASMPKGQQSQGPQPSPMQPLSAGPDVGKQLSDQITQPIENAMQPANPNMIAEAAQAQPQQPQQQVAPVPIFEQLLGGTDVSKLDPDKQKQLKFLGMISDQLQNQGKTLQDPEFQGLVKKIKQTLKGKPGIALEESARFENAYPQAAQEPEKPMVKGAPVITPTGDLATVESHPGKAAKVMVDGKQQVFNADELTPVPDNHEEIGQLYQNLIDKIPEGQKSRVYDAIGYDPVRNAIKYTYHDGKSYIIDDVPEEIAKEIANSGFLAKTSGGNYMGFYYKGNPSIGAGMHVLINDLQKLRGGKGKEYSYKFEELYSQHRLPKNILKEKHEREKAREREEKKAKKKRSSP